MENTLQNKNNQRVVHYESMRELGGFRFILGGAFLLFAIFFLWNGIYIMAGIIVILTIISVENCSEVIIDKDTMRLIKRIGVIKPFLTIKSKSIKDAQAVSIETFTTLQNRNKSREKTIKTRHRLFFELPGQKIQIQVFFDKGKANAFAKEISKLLDLNLERL
jgi:hypothetical protein